MSKRKSDSHNPAFDVNQQTRADLEKATRLLHNIGMITVSGLYSLPTGQLCPPLSHTHPGLHDCRSLIDLIHFCRAELSGMARLLIEKNVFTAEEWSVRMIDEYTYLAHAKAKDANVQVTDYGLIIKPPHEHN